MLNHTSIATNLASYSPLRFASWTDRYTDTHRETILAESFDGRVLDAMANKWHPLHTSEYLWTKSAFPNILLRYVGDNIDMVHHVESRTPFLDHHLTEYANGIPPSLKAPYDPQTGEFREKHILREAVKPFVTEEIYNQTKKPYIGPLRFSENGPMHNVIRKLVTEANVAQLGFVDWEKTKGLVDKAFVEKDQLAFRGAMITAQFVVLAQKFGVKTAGPDH
jgi:asparagine synthase (glutamine-hydrolysing)